MDIATLIESLAQQYAAQPDETPTQAQCRQAEHIGRLQAELLSLDEQLLIATRRIKVLERQDEYHWEEQAQAACAHEYEDLADDTDTREHLVCIYCGHDASFDENGYARVNEMKEES